MSNTYHDTRRGYRAEIDGARDMSVAELRTWSCWGEIVKDWTFPPDRHGREIPPRDEHGNLNVHRLTLEESDWLQDQIIKAARDEIIDPEA